MTIYFDSFAGLVPCRPIIRESDNTLKIRITRSRGCYKAGEILTVGNWQVVEKVGKRLIRSTVIVC